MTHEEIIALIRAGVTRPADRSESTVWADFGAGRGAFTKALRDLLGPDADLIAIDRDDVALTPLRRTSEGQRLETLTADFTRPLALPPLDGALMANALHWIPGKHHMAVLQQVSGYLRPGAVFILVEYAVEQPRSYIPHPVPFARFESLAAQMGLVEVQQIGQRRSPSNGLAMYAAAAKRPPA